MLDIEEWRADAIHTTYACLLAYNKVFAESRCRGHHAGTKIISASKRLCREARPGGSSPARKSAAERWHARRATTVGDEIYSAGGLDKPKIIRYVYLRRRVGRWLRFRRRGIIA